MMCMICKLHAVLAFGFRNQSANFKQRWVTLVLFVRCFCFVVQLTVSLTSDDIIDSTACCTARSFANACIFCYMAAPQRQHRHYSFDHSTCRIFEIENRIRPKDSCYAYTYTSWSEFSYLTCLGLQDTCVHKQSLQRRSIISNSKTQPSFRSQTPSQSVRTKLLAENHLRFSCLLHLEVLNIVNIWVQHQCSQAFVMWCGELFLLQLFVVCCR